LYFLRKGVKLHFYSLGTIFEENMRVSRGMQSLGSGFPIGARSIPVGTRFCLQSLVCYTLCRRCCENAVAAGEGKGIFTAGKQGCDCVARSRKRRTGFISRQGVYECPRPSSYAGLWDKVSQTDSHIHEKTDRVSSQN